MNRLDGPTDAVCVCVCAFIYVTVKVKRVGRAAAKMAILFHLQVNGKYLSVMTQCEVCVCVSVNVCKRERRERERSVK